MTTTIAHIRRADDELLLVVEGRLDSTQGSEFQDALSRAIEITDQRVVLDLAEVSYISSAGLRALLVVGKDLQKRNARLSLVAMQSSVREVFALSGFDKIFEISDSGASG